MVQSIPLALTATSLLLLPYALADGLYSKTSPVIQVSGATYDGLIAKSNHTSIVEFYAPWCGHCQSLKPAFEKAAKSLTGLAKVAAVNCDEESNKPFCGSMGVQGFPTLKIVKPGKKSGKPIVEDYQGARTAKGIVDAVIDKIPNHVKRLKDDDYKTWLEAGHAPRAILFSDKGTTSALLKAIAVDFLGGISIAQMRDSEKQAVKALNIDKFPTLVLLPGERKDLITYKGEMKKDAMVEFLSQAAEPNPDPAPKKAKSSSKSEKSQASKDSSSFVKSSASQASSQAKTDKASQTIETIDDESLPTESPDPNVITDDAQKPVKLPEQAPPIQSLSDAVMLQRQCLNSKAGTCILALLPEEADITPNSLQVISSLSEIHHKHEAAKRNLFPFFQLPSTNPEADSLRKKLSLGSGVEVIALNGKRSWYRHYYKTSYSQAEIEDWIDSIRMGDGAKAKVPDGLIVDADELATDAPKADTNDAQAMRDAIKSQMPDGVGIEVEEITDEEIERMMEAGSKAAEAVKDKKADMSDTQAMREALKSYMPEGAGSELDDVTDEELEQIMAEGKKYAEAMQAESSENAQDERLDEHDEL